VGVIVAVYVCKRDTRHETPRGTDDPAEAGWRYDLRTMREGFAVKGDAPGEVRLRELMKTEGN
jgi:hypothetical protein